jgi:hypothetical protein
MWEDDDFDGEFISPEDFLASDPVPVDARRMGLDRNTQEGALIAMAGALNPEKLSHRIIAWVLIFVFAGPVLLSVAEQIF